MTRGIGPAQGRILDVLAASEQDWLDTAELAAATALVERRVRAATDGLAQRGLLVITRGFTRWRGTGEYGRLMPVNRYGRTGEPVTLVVEPGDPYPNQPAWRRRPHLATRRIDYGHIGMPSYGRMHWLPERHAEHERQWAARWGRLREAEAALD